MPVAKRTTADRELAVIQLSNTEDEALSDATVEGKTAAKKQWDYVSLGEEKFRLREKIGALAMFKWSAASELSTEDPRALAAIYVFLKSLIHKEDWQAFEDHALDEDADAEVLLDVITNALEVISGRPTAPSSPSSAG
jgi:hypothetical protein